jgi:ABC-type polysaccharide/polyol phosphate transport system ATPase subunit
VTVATKANAYVLHGSEAMNAIEVRDVRKVYRRYGRRKNFSTLKSALLSGSLFRDLRPDETFEALKDVSFDVPKGKTLGVIGRNGSGKSTLLKLIAGIGKPTSGSIRVDGRVSALIELGAGFHPEISGRDNVFINGMMLGLTKREIVRRFDEIVAFAELEDFIDAPVKTYSSGMYVRLGFAVAIHVDPDVLLVDEVLAVGDQAFTQKCLDKFAELRRRGRTVLLVTHSLDLVTRFCEQALWLDAGTMRAHGDPKRVIDAYLADIAAMENRQLAAINAAAVSAATQAVPSTEELQVQVALGTNGPNFNGTEPPDMFRASQGRWGSREAEIIGVELCGTDGEAITVFQTGDPVEIRLKIRAHQRLSDFVVGVGIFNMDNVCCYGTNTQIEGGTGGEVSGDGEARLVIDRLDLVEGTYKLDAALHKMNGVPYDYHRLLYTFRVKSRRKDVGVFRPPHRWSFSGGIRIKGFAGEDQRR